MCLSILFRQHIRYRSVTLELEQIPVLGIVNLSPTNKEIVNGMMEISLSLQYGLADRNLPCL